MPIKMSKKGGGTKKRSFDGGVSDLKKQGKSDESARKIMGLDIIISNCSHYEAFRAPR